MTDEIVSLTLVAPDRLEVGVRRGPDIALYELTKVATPLALMIEFDQQFHLDFSGDPDARMRVLQVARRAFRGERVEPPITLSGPVENGD